MTHTCVVETVQHRRFPEVQPSEGDGGEQRALRVAGSLQALQSSGLRAAGHHRLQPVVQDVHHPQGALLGRRTGAAHFAPVPLYHTRPGGVFYSHIGDLCALHRVHSAEAGEVFLLYALLRFTPVTVPPPWPPHAHLLPICRCRICDPASPPH